MARVNYGFEILESKYVDASEAKSHLIFLSQKGIGLKALSEKLNISKSCLQQIRSGKIKNIDKKISSKILATPAIPFRGGQYVDAKEAHKLVAQLLSVGYKRAHIETALRGKQIPKKTNKRIRAEKLELLIQVHKKLMSPNERQKIK